MTDLTIFDRLKMPFPSASISWRVGNTNAKYVNDGEDVKGIPLAYIDARDVMGRLDEVVGPENWSDSYSVHGPKTICRLSLRINGEWISKEDGAGDSDMEAEKGAISDAFKRSAVRWGIGRYLYDIKAGKILVGKKGKFLSISDEARGELDALHDKHIEQMEWGDRAERNAYRLVLAALANLDTHLLETFEKDNAGVIATLPVAMRQNLSQKIGQMGAERAKREAA